MRFYHSATALALITTTAFAQQCPPGYERSKKLNWKACGKRASDGLTFECATLEVPRDWKNVETSDKLVLQLIRQPASNPNAKSIIVNPGGPGESGIETIIKGDYQSTLGDFHIVSFDPRGVGETMPYEDCSADDDSSKWADPYKDGDDAATFGYKQAKAYGAACAAKNQKWGTLIGTAYVARDIMAMVDAFKAAGEDGLIRYAGYSYGTLLGATLTAMFPDKIARVLLDGNINPDDYYRGDGTEAGADVTKGVENFFAQCAKAGKAKCALADNGQTAQQLLAEYDALLAKVDSKRNYIVRNEFFKILYFRTPTAFRDFAVDLKAWITNNDSIKEREDKEKRADFQVSTWKKLQQKQAIIGITCGDRVAKGGSPATYSQLENAYKQKLKYSYDISFAGQFECTVWEQTAAERFEGSFANIKTKHPILIVNTPYDPVTPAISAEASRKAFLKSKLVMSNGVGHCSSAHTNKELNKAIKKYFEDGTLPEQSEYAIEDNNVFTTIPDQAEIPSDEPTAPPTKRDFRLPEYFQKRADDIPADCSKIPVPSSALLSPSASVVPSASAFVSVSMSASASASQSAEPIPAASPSASASASESLVLSHSESASASALAVPTASVSQSKEPTSSASSSLAVTGPASASHSESAAVLTTASASVPASYEASPSASASVSVQQSSESVHASVTPSTSATESYVASPTASTSAHSESASVSGTHVSSSVVYSGLSHSASASVAGEQESRSSSVVISVSVSADMYSSSVIGSASASASASMDYAATASTVAQSSSYPAESLTRSASATPVYNQGSASITASASTTAHVGVSSSVYPGTSSSAVSGLASLSYSAMSSSSAVFSDSSIVHPSASSSVVYPDTSVQPSGSSSVVYSHSSQYPSGSSSMIHSARSSVSASSSAVSYYAASTPVYSSGSSTLSTFSKTKPFQNHYPTSMPYASSTPAKSIVSKYPYSSSPPTYSSSVAPYPYGYDYAAGGDYANGNAYSTGYYAITASSKPKGPKTTSTPCITVPWSSQPGYVPITKTYTATSIRTITKCPDTVKDCPLNSSTKTYITTEIKTRTIVVATPSSSPTGNKSYPPNKEGGMMSSASLFKETGKVPSPPKDSGYPSQPAKDTGKGGQPPKETKSVTSSRPTKDTGYPSQPSKPTGNSSQPPKETKPIQSTHSAYALPRISSKPSVPTSVPPYPTVPSTPSSIKVCNDAKCSYVTIPTGTKPVASTGASTTLKTSTPSVSVCVGKDCKATGTPTGYKPAQFTGAASREFVSSMVGAGAMIVAFARLF